MTIKKILLFTVFISFLFTCKQENIATVAYQNNIIPKPQNVKLLKGAFIFDDNVYLEFDNTFSISANFLKNYIENGSSIKLNNNKSEKTIKFTKDESITNPEAYKLEINRTKIEIKASSDQGAFYAVQSIRQLLSYEFENGSYKLNITKIPCLTIEDAPQFKYRGMHLDVGRHMYSVEFIKKYIDALAMLKMNTFHWHLTEDQGWRIEIKKYPKLQEIAAYRSETLIGHYSDQPHQFDGKRYGGFYTQEEVKDIVAYAQERHVTVIPEIELPGHSQAAIAAYPGLGCTGKQIEAATKWGVFEDIYCSKESTFEFLEDVLDEVLELFPSKYIHIGGDEAPKSRWKHCDDCQKLIKQKGLKDEHELQSYFISRIETYLNNKGRQIIGWDEILEGGLAPNATVMSWRGMNGAVEAAKQNHNVIMTPTSHCYFDYYQSENESEPTAIGGFLPLEKVYSFNPIPEELTIEESKHVLGVQGNIWTEYMPNEKHVEYMMFPRVLAMSEVGWTQPELKEYHNFSNRVENFHERLDALNINYANHFYEVEGDIIKKDSTIFYKLSAPTQKFDIKFTTNNTEPTTESSTYLTPIQIDSSTTIKAVVFDGKGKLLGNTFTQYINYHKGVGASIKMNVEPNKSYPGSGAYGLINGVSGSDKRFGDKEWLGFWGDDIEIIIDLGESTNINNIKTRFYNGQGQWIYAPKKITIELDDTLLDYKTNSKNELITNVEIGVGGQYSRFIKLTIPNYGIIPEGKQGAGNKAWTFIDEIIIN
ncbi:beta-N-acetylhexosaminidase [Pontimicrobium sp. IMCC45349]|uniref:beta-N-acetylhexosaminidase n=1 Tax=Pontimicrobium sp. IMCC45349 TaxID=3391574 RepID=UPI0039A26A5F